MEQRRMEARYGVGTRVVGAIRLGAIAATILSLTVVFALTLLAPSVVAVGFWSCCVAALLIGSRLWRPAVSSAGSAEKEARRDSDLVPAEASVQETLSRVAAPGFPEPSDSCRFLSLSVIRPLPYRRPRPAVALRSRN
jgi:hypothetical protein